MAPGARELSQPGNHHQQAAELGAAQAEERQRHTKREHDDGRDWPRCCGG